MQSNTSNKEFYHRLPLSVFQSFAEQGGFVACKDVELVYAEYLSHATSILEVGAGYGRVVDFLIKNKFPNTITALEQAQELVDLLTKKYRSLKNVQVLHFDLLHDEFTAKYDCILWMFSGLVDFGKTEQVAMITKLSKALNKNGYLMIEIPQLTTLTNAEFVEGQFIKMQTPYGIIESYIPNEAELNTYAEQAGLTLDKVLRYQTTTNKDRVIFVLQK
jgi:phospholipid N-methyltransferase